MSMFCYQCQEASKGIGCTIQGVCGKKPETSGLQDLLIYVSKGVSLVALEAQKLKIDTSKADYFVMESLFMTITNANFDDSKFTEQIQKGLSLREALKLLVDKPEWPEVANWKGNAADFQAKAKIVGILSTENEDIRSLRELLIYGLKGMAVYAQHAYA